ncbi:MAG TPA: serine/threonine-protein kinase [Candidatus Polarisedimenticolaceae bacterium]
MPPQEFGRYRVERELGRGAMGAVFLAHDPEIDRRVAVKTIQVFSGLPDAEREQARRRFLTEARSAGRLVHPGIVTIFDVGEADGAPWIAMEYIEGQTLDAFCRRDRLLGVDVVVDIVAGLAETLAYAHQAGVVHRDIKPTNLIRTGERAVKIMDFGLAQSGTAGRTQDGHLLGTPNYMAPEQIRGDRADARTDLWSLAVVLFELLTGEKPFAGDSVSSVLYRVVHEPPRELGPHLERVPVALAGFLKKALAKDPQARFADGAAFAWALREARRATADRATPAARSVAAPAAEPAGSGRSSLLPYLFGAAAVIASVVGVLAWRHAESRRQAAAFFETTVRAEPSEAAVTLDGAPLADPRLRVPSAGPFPRVSAAAGCRRVEHLVAPSDAGREIVLVLDPEKAAVAVDAGVDGAALRVNGESAGTSPREIELDLCRENRLEAAADGYTPAAVVVPAGASPKDARGAAAALRLAAIPTGRIVVPAPGSPVRWLVDGKPAQREDGSLRVPAGRREVRAVNEDTFVDVTAVVDVPPDGHVDADLRVPPLAELLVQAFPPNAKVYVRRGGGWRYLDDVPLERQIAAGSYELRVEYVPTGATQERKVSLRPGENPPLRFAFESKR